MGFVLFFYYYYFSEVDDYRSAVVARLVKEEEKVRDRREERGREGILNSGFGMRDRNLKHKHKNMFGCKYSYSYKVSSVYSVYSLCVEMRSGVGERWVTCSI